MKIKITADSTCDLSRELIEENNIEILPLYVVKDGVSYRDGVEITPQDIFDFVAQGNDPCKTAAASEADYIDCFSRFSSQYDAVIHINISAEFSSCHQNACLAARQFPNVYPVDSRNLSTGSGQVVMEAVRLADMGLSAEDIVHRLQELAGRVEASFVIDSLEYLRKGGRCSALAALGANLLNLKPCIEVVDGKMKVGKKYRGKLSRVLVRYTKDQLEKYDHIRKDHIFITHSGIDPSLIEDVRNTILENGDFSEIHITKASCTISAHCGPNTLGVLFLTD